MATIFKLFEKAQAQLKNIQRKNKEFAFAKLFTCIIRYPIWVCLYEVI